MDGFTDGIKYIILFLSIVYIVYQIFVYIDRCKQGREWDKIVNNDANFIPVSKMFDSNEVQKCSLNHVQNNDELGGPVSSVVEEPFPIGDALKRLQEEVPSDDDDVNELDEYTKALVKEQEKQNEDLKRWLALDYLFNDSI